MKHFKGNTYYLSEIQGIIANCALENDEHKDAYLKISELVNKFGPLKRMDWDLAMKICYGKEEA